MHFFQSFLYSQLDIYLLLNPTLQFHRLILHQTKQQIVLVLISNASQFYVFCAHYKQFYFTFFTQLLPLLFSAATTLGMLFQDLIYELFQLHQQDVFCAKNTLFNLDNITLCLFFHHSTNCNSY